MPETRPPCRVSVLKGPVRRSSGSSTASADPWSPQPPEGTPSRRTRTRAPHTSAPTGPSRTCRPRCSPPQDRHPSDRPWCRSRPRHARASTPTRSRWSRTRNQRGSARTRPRAPQRKQRRRQGRAPVSCSPRHLPAGGRAWSAVGQLRPRRQPGRTLTRRGRPGASNTDRPAKQCPASHLAPAPPRPTHIHFAGAPGEVTCGR